jgi:hypothetical protein
VLQISAELYGDPISRPTGVLALLYRRWMPRGARSAPRSRRVGVYRALANGARIAGNGGDTGLFAAMRTRMCPR